MIELVDLVFAVVFGATTMTMALALVRENWKLNKMDKRDRKR